MAQKKIKAIVKLQIEGGKANPAPPVGTALGPHGIQIQQFCQQFNEKTRDRMGEVVPAVVSIFEDRTFTFILKTSPVADLIKKELKLAKGSGVPQKDKVGKLTKDQVRKIAEIKMPDVNANDVDAAMKIVAGTARSMGVTIAE